MTGKAYTAVIPLTITPYHRRYLQFARDLLFHNDRVHTHLDWHDTDAWIESSDSILRLAWYKGNLVGLMGLSAPLNRASWIRLAAVQDLFHDPEGVLCALWDGLIHELQGQVSVVALLAVQDWILRYVPVLGFSYSEDIITLARAGYDLPDPLPNAPTIRSAELRDLPALVAVDQTAFAPPWQLSGEEIRQAYRISSSCTVAEKDHEIVGYQLSTLYFDGAHLARLAVLPQTQGNGVGGALLGDLLQRFFRRGVYMMTVNTQASNEHSRHLYARFGFRPNGFDLPYWSTHL
jgi:[ribosomal protein S18]-alanine N-acetyltransferase